MKPNILILMCDQLTADAVYNPACITPNFDRLRARGLTFERAYTSNAVCSPARAGIMTGLLPHNHGVLVVTHTADSDQALLRRDKPHFAMRLKEAGYTTGYFGKWHVENTEQPAAFGWDVDFSTYSSAYRKTAEALQRTPHFSLKKCNVNRGYNANSILYGAHDIPSERRPMGIAARGALDFLREHAQDSAPWCCMLSVPEPHDPFICNQDYLDRYDIASIRLPDNLHDDLAGRPNLYRRAQRIWEGMTEREHREARACYYASVTEIDAQFGRVLDFIACRDDVIVILTADHGENLGAHGLYCKNIMATEEVYNVPLVFAGKGIAQGASTPSRVGTHGLCNTILELAGARIIEHTDHASFARLLAEPARYESAYTRGYAEYHGGRFLLTQRVIWDGEWKYVFNGFDFDELYNLKDDPHELHNLAELPEYADRLKEMCAQLWANLKRTGDASVYNSQYPILRLMPFGPYDNEKLSAGDYPVRD